MKTPGDGGLTWQRQQLPARSREGKGERRYDFLVHHDCFFIAGTILRSINPASPILESISDESLGRICIWITFWLRAFWHYSLEIQLVARLIFFAIGENRLKCVLKPVSYTHLDVYKRQPQACHHQQGLRPSFKSFDPRSHVT